MKTRILSGIAIVALVIGFLWAREYYSPLAEICMAALNAVACFEMLWRTGRVKVPAVLAVAVLYSAMAPFAYSGYFLAPALLGCIFVFLEILLMLRYHSRISAESFGFAAGMPILLSYAFSALVALLNRPDGRGLFYFLLLFSFSSVADTGAYFVGSFCGKHKLCPVISPKKTVEGVAGGMVLSLIVTALIVFIYGSITGVQARLWLLLALTPVFCAIGICGDLFASCIKRSAGIKDYGNLIPGHGGILDRVDSILLIAPALDLTLRYVEVF